MVTNCKDLSFREQEVLRMLSEGYSREEMAITLKWSISTINHMLSRSAEDRRSIYSKIGVTNQRSAINWYNENCKKTHEVAQTEPTIVSHNKSYDSKITLVKTPSNVCSK